jgi:hypothetical protein
LMGCFLFCLARLCFMWCNKFILLGPEKSGPMGQVRDIWLCQRPLKVPKI